MISTTAISPILTIPPLENGDKLTRHEFERRYHAMPNLKKAELIEGVVYVASPLRIKSHGEPHAYIMTWLGVYKAATPGIGFADNATVLIDTDNEPQPDALLRIETGGQSRINKDDYVEGAPELIVEIAASSASYDLHEKLKVYRRNQVQEYLIWRVYDHQFDWFRLQQGEYIQLQPNADSIICSQVFPGLWLDKIALLGGDLGKVLTVVQQGLASPEHEDFISRLSS
ncbi:Uma2 family endonuclease [Dolichospermum circinale CS-534/05]|uniref:Uma2 family endonuclease n=1 Tax=Dolichospermum circinale CS-537/01 TaxID=3021739 RepID=A0ABT5A5H2_9CYAN|nr:Uma2 family endonuclease [Dolichospermum circinale]MDB9465919.1 Uma2 family endonuclease [Dolichospermum circinale CS-539/09]MDB9471203.1 Uma2 family endonuclease [Dolichospermum circinale CS-539]MDB9486769.1 Uma2 family endonuclease [Dolichospermum circinale CS-537/01]MDB9489671.1 Uma2 family endonuclease [Dolichospermum circinale CS-534/05]